MLNNFEIVVPFHNGHSTIHKLIKSIPSSIRITVVDDFSDEPLLELPYKNVKIIKGSKRGYFAGAVNLGIFSTENDVLILNQDTYFSGTGWIDQLHTALNSGYSYIGERIKGERADWPKGYIHGTFMYLTRELIDKTGLLNQRDFPMWGCTAEYQLRAARNNFKILPLEHVIDFVHLRQDGKRFGESFTELAKQEPKKVPLFVSTPPLVSVIIPVHNFSTWLKSTVNSLVGGETDLGNWKQQTFAGFEVLIVDDSSTDETPEMIKTVCDPWKGVRSIRLNRPRKEVWDNVKNKYIGKVAALNQGIKESFGKYIMVLDADDMIKPDRIERFYNEQIRNPKSFIYDNLQFFGNGEIIPYVYPEHTLVVQDGAKYRQPNPKAGQSTLFPKLQDYDFETLIYKNHVHSSIMFPREAWETIGGYPRRFIYGREDWAIAVKFGVFGYCGVRLRDYHGLLYRREGQNRTIENSRHDWMKFFQSQMRQEFPQIYIGERTMGCCGKGAQQNNSRNQAFANVRISQEINMDGVSWVTYIGGRTAGAFSTWGYATGTQYRVTPGKKFRADNRDLKDNTRQKRGLLEKVEFGKPMFTIVEEVVEPVPVFAQVEEVEEFTVTVVQDDEVTSDELDTSVLDGNVTLFTKALSENDYSPDDLSALLAYEQANKNRASVIDRLETLLLSG